MEKDDRLEQEDEMEDGSNYYDSCLHKIESGTFTKEDLEDINQKSPLSSTKYIKYGVEMEGGEFDLDTKLIDDLISCIDEKEFDCDTKTAENYKKFFEILKPEIENLTAMTSKFMKCLIQDIDRDLGD